jgi:hypothetical protein
MASTIPELEWASLTEQVNEIKGPQRFLMDFLFSSHRTVSTDLIEIPTIRGGRDMAGFTAKDAEALMVEGYTQDAKAIRGISQRLKKLFTPTPLLFNRGFDQVIHLTPGQNQSSMVQAHIAQDSERIVTLMTNAQEYLCSQTLNGALSYTNEADGVSFSLDFGKSTANTVVLAGADLWTASTSVPSNDVMDALERQSDELGLTPTDVIMGTEAAAAFLANAQIRSDLDNRRIVNNGTINLGEKFSDQGVLFLGNIYGMNWWRYGRSIVVPGLGSTPLVSPKMAHFVSRSSEAQQVLYFTAIRDMEAFMGGVLEGERYSKSWMEHDPSALIQLVESHPLPCLRRPDSIYSLQVVA